eukprot:CAMPEP_0116864256 /NCGR_PEP_ID=MMETSP0418-20121206/24716_1 /TAXON_ID=1158023 /ORGANISM="Astrosyne radiata, Strain 13vi08-1A" /LENGTH=537 /DNA_ID=CAMNT_0004499447 /DNA_START=2551 /DNA_END=4164 /DNA_ORIENTATION=+
MDSQPWQELGLSLLIPFAPDQHSLSGGGGLSRLLRNVYQPGLPSSHFDFPEALAKLVWETIERNNANTTKQRAFTSIDSPVIAVGGLDDDGYPVARVESYDAASNRRTVLPANLHDCAVVPAKYSVVVMGGLSSHGDGQILNTDSRRWTKLPSRNEVRLGFAARSLLLARKHTVGGGGSRKAEPYDPTVSERTNHPAMSAKRSHCAVAVVGKKAHDVFGGEGLASAEVFDMDTQRWDGLSPMSRKHDRCTAAAICNPILVIGIDPDGSGLWRSPVVRLRSGRKTWCFHLPNLNNKRQDCAVIMATNQVAVVGGKQRERNQKETIAHESGEAGGRPFCQTQKYRQSQCHWEHGATQRSEAMAKTVGEKKLEYTAKLEDAKTEYSEVKAALEASLRKLETRKQERVDKIQSWVGEMNVEVALVNDMVERPARNGPSRRDKRALPPASLVVQSQETSWTTHPVLAANSSRSAMEELLFARTPEGENPRSPTWMVTRRPIAIRCRNIRSGAWLAGITTTPRNVVNKPAACPVLEMTRVVPV